MLNTRQKMEADEIRNGDLDDKQEPLEFDTESISASESIPNIALSPANSPSEPSSSPSIQVKVTHNKKSLDVTVSLDRTVRELKDMLAVLTGIPPDKQKIMWSKGTCADDTTLQELGAKTGSKFMMVGSSNQEVSDIQTKPDPSTLKEEKESGVAGESLGEQTIHRKIIDKGIPSDAMPGILGESEVLPPHPISGMVNKRGASVRLTFKLEVDQVWIGTKERTEKVQLGQIRKVVSEPVVGHEEYHVMGLQMGPTEASTYWIYWVPAQYVNAIREVFSQFD